jgi:hypothetical protein
VKLPLRVRNPVITACLIGLSCLTVALGRHLFYDPLVERTFPAYAEGPDRLRVSDFVSFYMASDLVRSDERLHVYDPEVQRAAMNKLLAPLVLPRVFYFQSVPFLFPLLAPLSLIGIYPAYVSWSVAGLAFGCSIAWLFLTRFTDLGARGKLAFCLLTILSGPSASSLELGQTGWFNLGFVLLFFYGLFVGKLMLAGVALAFTGIKPQFTLLLAAPLLGLSKWRGIASAAVAEAVLLLAAVATIGIDNVVRFPQLVHHAETSADFAGVATPSMVCLRAALVRVFDERAALLVSYALMICVVVMLIGLWRDGATSPVVHHLWLGAITVVWCLIASPHAHLHDLLLLAAPAAMTLALGSLRQVFRESLFTRTWCVVLLGYPLWSLFILRLADGNRMPLLACNLLLGIAGLAHYVLYVRHNREPGQALVGSRR